MVAAADVSILSRVLDFEHGQMSRELAQYVLELDYPPRDKRRYETLASRVQEPGALNDAERAELEAYVRVDDLLAILRVKAMRALGKPLPTLD